MKKDPVIMYFSRRLKNEKLAMLAEMTLETMWSSQVSLKVDLLKNLRS